MSDHCREIFVRLEAGIGIAAITKRFSMHRSTIYSVKNLHEVRGVDMWYGGGTHQTK